MGLVSLGTGDTDSFRQDNTAQHITHDKYSSTQRVILTVILLFLLSLLSVKMVERLWFLSSTFFVSFDTAESTRTHTWWNNKDEQCGELPFKIRGLAHPHNPVMPPVEKRV